MAYLPAPLALLPEVNLKYELIFLFHIFNLIEARLYNSASLFILESKQQKLNLAHKYQVTMLLLVCCLQQLSAWYFFQDLKTP